MWFPHDNMQQEFQHDKHPKETRPQGMEAQASHHLSHRQRPARLDAQAIMTVFVTFTQTMLVKYYFDAKDDMKAFAADIGFAYPTLVAGEKNEALLTITLPDGIVCNRMVNFFVTKRGDKRVAVRGINQLIKAGDTITISRIARREAA